MKIKENDLEYEIQVLPYARFHDEKQTVRVSKYVNTFSLNLTEIYTLKDIDEIIKILLKAKKLFMKHHKHRYVKGG
jgi:hypothetical protein